MINVAMGVKYWHHFLSENHAFKILPSRPPAPRPRMTQVSSPISSKPQVCLPAVRDRQSSVVALCPRGVEEKTGNCLDLCILNYPQLQGCSEHPKYGGKTG